MAIKLFEYGEVLGAGITLSSSNFWFHYLFVTGLHFLHVLIALTLGSYRLAGADVAAATGAAAWLLGVAALKGHLIAGLFMEMRRGPLVWAALMSGFLIAEAALIVAILP